ncbi:MAG: hypothetical protein ACYTG6_13550, partial [Planctomycetota bacterium]
MPWKTEIDRLVHHIALEAAQGGEAETRRAARAVSDLVALAPDREVSHFHAGVLEEILEMRAAKREGDAEPEASSEGDPADAGPGVDVPAAEGAAERWRHLGRLDAASRRGSRERVRGLMDEPSFEACLVHPEGRVALRAVGRMLLRDGEDERAFDLYRRHLEAVDDEGSRRDAEFLLEESLRRVDRGGASQEDAGARLARAAAFAEAAGLDARARSKVDRKLGRLHQLEERWEEAARCYRDALERLPADDPYRSVLVGDLALATLGVRGTLDLLPVTERADREKAEEILQMSQ